MGGSDEESEGRELRKYFLHERGMRNVKTTRRDPPAPRWKTKSRQNHAKTAVPTMPKSQAENAERTESASTSGNTLRLKMHPPSNPKCPSMRSVGSWPHVVASLPSRSSPRDLAWPLVP